jgi:CubicO group peptidase (beta-lactamase class C family)
MKPFPRTLSYFVAGTLGLVLIVGAEKRGSGRATTHPSANGISVGSPESVGFSSERLKRLEDQMEEYVSSKQLAGGVTMLARHGKVVEFKTYGVTDVARNTPTAKDSLFRIYSMTKPITGVAMMMLYEEGKWRPDDLVSKYIPEFKDLKVYKGKDDQGNVITEAAQHPPTMRELLTHTAGFTYGIFGNTPVDKMYVQKDVLGSKTLHEAIQKLAGIPLLYQPGTQWVYSWSVDIQGYIIEKLTGKPLGDFFKERIFDPLKMKDTAFYVPSEKFSRLVTLYGANAKGELNPASFGGDLKVAPTAPSGGGGLVSTAEDYMRFAQMLLNRGQLDGVRLLAPSTVTLMSSDHTPKTVIPGTFSPIRPGIGFGYDCAVAYDPLEAGVTLGKGSYWWSGAAGTWFWIDPANDLVFVGMIQKLSTPEPERMAKIQLYQALVEPEK